MDLVPGPANFKQLHQTILLPAVSILDRLTSIFPPGDLIFNTVQ